MGAAPTEGPSLGQGSGLQLPRRRVRGRALSRGLRVSPGDPGPRPNLRPSNGTQSPRRTQAPVHAHTRVDADPHAHIRVQTRPTARGRTHTHMYRQAQVHAHTCTDKAHSTRAHTRVDTDPHAHTMYRCRHTPEHKHKHTPVQRAHTHVPSSVETHTQAETLV